MQEHKQGLVSETLDIFLTSNGKLTGGGHASFSLCGSEHLLSTLRVISAGTVLSVCFNMVSIIQGCHHPVHVIAPPRGPICNRHSL